MPTYCHESESGDHCPEINSMTLTLPLMNSARVTANETKVALVHLQDAAEVLIEKGNLQKGRERCNRLRQEIKGATAQTVTPCYYWRARRDSNSRPTDSKSVALSS
jgi:hypothetical protein